jgi:hypothetical protein
MATKSTPKGSGGKKPPPKKVSPSKAAPGSSSANGPTAVGKAVTGAGGALARDIAPPEAAAASELCQPDEVAPCTRSHIPNARTRKALRDADAGKNLTRYADEDELFRGLGIKLGQEKA